MGIRNLWKTVSDTKERKSLADITYDMRVDATLRGRDRVIPCLGIDLSPCMDECISASIAQGVHGQQGPLHMFFKRLLHYSEVKATFVFVLDGPDRPAIKRGHQVRHTVWWSEIVQGLVRTFGFCIHQAPGEAEAELAMLNRSGIIDGVISSDSDALVFGSQTVIRTIPRRLLKSRGTINDEVEVYNFGRIQNQINISRGGLFLFALLNGGDYDVPGVRNCGSTIALALIRSGYGDELQDAIDLYLPDNEAAFRLSILEWRARMCSELRSNSRQYLSNRRPDIADTMEQTDFPNLQVLMSYVAPLTSESGRLGPTSTLKCESWYLFHEPSLSDIVQFCQTRLFWTNPETLVKKLSQHVFPSIVLRMLHSPITIFDNETRKLVSPTLQVTVNSVTWKKRKGRAIQQPRLNVSILMLIRLSGLRVDASDSTAIKVWGTHRDFPLALQLLDGTEE